MLSVSRENPPLLIPSTALIVSSEGTRVGVIGTNGRVHVQAIAPGCDYGDRVEVMSGLRVGETIVATPSDVLHEGDEIDPYPEPLENAGK
jgi:hypothetical protein